MGKVNPSKVAIIGCGFVGSASAFALMQSGLFNEMVLLDANHDKAEGEARDIAHGLPFVRPMKLYAGGYDDIADAAIIVITAVASPSQPLLVNPSTTKPTKLALATMAT